MRLKSDIQDKCRYLFSTVVVAIAVILPICCYAVFRLIRMQSIWVAVIVIHSLSLGNLAQKTSGEPI